MGRWAQARRRGRAVAPFPFGAPAPEDWQIEDNGTGEVLITLLGVPPDPSITAVLVRSLSPATGGNWVYDAFAVLTGFTLIAPGSSGQTVTVQVAWGLDPATQVSDWSASKDVFVA